MSDHCPDCGHTDCAQDTFTGDCQRAKSPPAEALDFEAAVRGPDGDHWLDKDALNTQVRALLARKDERIKELRDALSGLVYVIRNDDLIPESVSYMREAINALEVR